MLFYMVDHYPEIFEDSKLGKEDRDKSIAFGEWALFKRKIIDLEGSIRASAADPERHTILAADGHHNCVLFNCETYKKIASLNTAEDESLKTSEEAEEIEEIGYPKAAIFCQGSFWVAFENAVLVLNRETLQVEHKLSVPANCLIAVNDSEVWIGSEKIITIVSATEYTEIAKIEVKEKLVTSMIVVDQQVWCALKEYRKRCVYIHQYDIKTRAHVSRFETCLKDVFSMALYGDNLWTASDGPGISIWDIKTVVNVTEKLKADISLPPITSCLCALPNQIWFGSQDGIVIADPKTQQVVGVLRGYQKDFVYSMIPVVYGDHTEIWSCGNKSLSVWSIVGNLPFL